MPPRKAARDDAVLSEDDLVGAQAVERKTAKWRAAPKKGTKRKAPATKPREPLIDRTNMQTVDTQEEANSEHDDLEKPKAKRAKTTQTKRKPAARAQEVEKPSTVTLEIPESQQQCQSIPEIEQTLEVIEPSVVASRRLPDRSTTSRAPSVQPTEMQPRARSVSVQPGLVYARERSTSTSANERRPGDPETRRQLVALTRECENLHLKNEALEDLVRTKAETNFDKLKRGADQKTKQADELVTALKKEIAALRKACSSTTTEVRTLRDQLSVMTEACETNKQDNSSLEQEVATLKQGLQGAENEKKALQAKLDVARQQSTSEASDAKSSSRSGGIKQTEAQKEAKMKENLYADLTGLLIRGIKRKDGEDEYDCLQTGRNGSLHFHLSIANESGSNPKTPGASFDEVEFYYEPFLEQARDKSLLEILPDYLSEDICFPRNHAIKFYSKVVESMTKRIVVEDE